ncbi:MAG: ribonuclease J [Pseudomonadota bacterium]
MTKKKSKERAVFLPLGGSGEIGMNMNLFGYGRDNHEKWIMVDCGVTFGGPDTPGVDIIFPDFEFIKERREDLKAIILTHAHEDHIGAIAYVWPELRVPLYATAFTARMIQDKFNDRGVDVKGFLNIVPLKSSIVIGDFRIEFVSMTHSIPEPNGIYIKTPAANIYHTGDWKFDPDPVLGEPTDHKRIAEIAAEGIDACICDSTNALDNTPSGSEAAILSPMVKALRKSTGRVAITTFASNVARMKTLMRAIKDSGRKCVLAGRSVERIFNHGRAMNYFEDLPEPVALEEVKDHTPGTLACICTGSQGEQRAALGKMARGIHPFFNLSEGDTVIFSSKTIPGNEKSVFTIYNMLAENGVTVLTSKDFDIHVSGHPTAPDLEKLYKILKPNVAIPVHGEIRHMNRHAEIALAHGANHAIVPQNGDFIEITREGVICDKEVEAGRLYLDGRIVEESAFGSASERKRLTYAGYAAIFVIVDKSGNLLSPPDIQSFGVPDGDKLFGRAGMEYLYHQLVEAYEGLDAKDYDDDQKISEAIRLSYRRTVNQAWGKKPITEVKVIRLGSALIKFMNSAS